MFKKKELILLGFLMIFGIFEIIFVLGATYHITQHTYDFSSEESVEDLIHETDSIMLRVNTGIETTCWYTDKEDFSPSNGFEGNYGTKHEIVLEGLEEGIHKYYVRCGDSPGNNSNPKMEVIFKTSIPIYGTIELSKEPPLKGGQYELTLTTSKIPLETPSLEYSLDGITKKEVSLKGNGKTWKGYLIIPDNLEEVVGSFVFSAKDLAGRIGTKLQGDKIFIIDTLKPETIATINAVGYKGQIRLDWFYYENIKEFNIYKSENPNLDYTDFYEITTKEYFIDTDVEKGKTYYYRVAGVDEAGNIASLSREVYATVLIDSSSSSSTETGLDVKLVGKVDNMITNIDSLIGTLNDIKTNMKSKEGKEKELFFDLRFDKEIDNLISELNSQKRDVENYKLQDLTENELDNKLNSVELRLNIIKKRAPENLLLLKEKEIIRELNEKDIQRSLLEYTQDEEYNYKKEIDFVFDTAEEKNLNLKSRYYQTELIYVDGSREDLTIIDDNFESQIEGIEDFFFIMIIPKNIAEDVSELNVITGNYETIKSDPVLSFSSDTKRVLYYIKKEIGLSSLEQIIISPIKLPDEEEKQSWITGFVVSDYFSGGSLGIIILVLFSLGLLFYLFKIKSKKDPEKPVLEILENVKKVGFLVKEKKTQEAKEIYNKIKEEYKKLSKKEKLIVVEEVKKIGGSFSK